MKIALIGECMVEVRDTSNSECSVAFGGDSNNAAVYLARIHRLSSCTPRIEVSYITALGADDPYSNGMIEWWQKEGIDTSLIDRIPGKLPGLYTIRTDEKGERSFHYWRSASAARDMMKGSSGARIADALQTFDWIYLSGITLSILEQECRNRLIEAIGRARRAGARVVFDSNYRPRGWPSTSIARTIIYSFLKEVDIALPTLDDERALSGQQQQQASEQQLPIAGQLAPRMTTMSALECARRIASFGVREIAVKDGANDALSLYKASLEKVSASNETFSLTGEEEINSVPTGEPVAPVDTTGAGDSFNSAYLCARICGCKVEDAVQAGHTLAKIVIQHRGAIMPIEAMPTAALDEILKRARLREEKVQENPE